MHASTKEQFDAELTKDIESAKDGVYPADAVDAMPDKECHACKKGESIKMQSTLIKPDVLARDKREKAIFFSVLSAIILIPLTIFLTIYFWPPVSSANIGMDYSSWEKHYKNDSENTHRKHCASE